MTNIYADCSQQMLAVLIENNVDKGYKIKKSDKNNKTDIRCSVTKVNSSNFTADIV